MHVLVPVSGGSDSALCFWLCNQALPGRVHGIYFGSELRASSWFDSVGTVERVELASVTENPEVARWSYSLECVLRDNLVLIGSQTKTEQLLGTYSNASRVAMVLPLAGTWKSDCVRLCKQVEVPQEIIDSSKRADIACGRTAEFASLSFEQVDDFLRMKTGETPIRPLDKIVCKYLETIYEAHAAKREFPVIGP